MAVIAREAWEVEARYRPIAEHAARQATEAQRVGLDALSKVERPKHVSAAWRPPGETNPEGFEAAWNTLNEEK